MFKLNEIAQKIYSMSPDLSFEDVLKKVKKLKKLHNPPFVKDEKDKRVHLYSESFFDVCLKEIYPDAAVKKLLNCLNKCSLWKRFEKIVLCQKEKAMYQFMG